MCAIGEAIPDILRLDRLSKSYGALRVTADLSLSLCAGEALGIIGPNGAGKTTLFNLIAGGVLPDFGTICFNGQNITNLPAPQRCRQGIGRSYQIPHPFIGMTVFENVLVGAEFGAGLSQADSYQRAVEALKQTALLYKANRRAATLTLLDRKRLEMARALATNPKLLLLDEIAGGLTDLECQELIATIREIRTAGVSIIWIEHIVHALVAVVDRLVVLNFGAKIAEGRPREVMASDVVREIYLGLDADG